MLSIQKFKNNSVFIIVIFSILAISQAKANETSPANRALAYLELAKDYKVVKEQKISATETKIMLINTSLGTKAQAFVVKTGADKWMVVMHFNTLDAGPLEIEDVLLIYSKGGKLPSEKSEQFESFVGSEYKNESLETEPGINLYSVLGLNKDNQAVEYMFDKLGISGSGRQKIYGSVNTYSSKTYLRMSTTLATKSQMRFPKWLHFEEKENLDLEIHCGFSFSNVFSKKPFKAIGCGSVFVKTLGEFDYGKVKFDLELMMGLGRASGKTTNASTKQTLASFTDYKFILEGTIEGAKEGELANIGDGIALEDVALEFEQTFFSKKSAEAGNIHNSLPKSTYTFGGKMELGESKVGLYGIFAPSVEKPWSAGLVSHIDKVTLKQLTETAQSMAKVVGAKPISTDLNDKIHQLPLDEFYLSNVTIAYTPEISNVAEIKEEGLTFAGSLTILKHLAGSVEFNVSEEGVRTKDSIQPFSLPGFEIKKANLNIYIPTSNEHRIKSAILNNLNFILINMNIIIAGVEEQIKFKIGISGFSFIFHLNITHDYSIRLIAEAPITAFVDVKKFRFEADLKVGNPNIFSDLSNDLKGGLADNSSLNLDISKLRPNFSNLQSRIDQATKDNSKAKSSYQSVKIKAQKDLDKITKPIKKAEDFLSKKMTIYNNAKHNWKHWIHKRNGYDWWKVDDIASAEAKIIYYEGKKDAAWGVVKLAKKALAIIQQSIHFIPVDAYPEVIEKLAVYRAKQYLLAIAKGALAAAKVADNEIKDFADQIQNNLDFFAITNISLSGDIKSGRSLSAKMKIMGESFHQDWSVSPSITLAASSSNIPDGNMKSMIKSLFSSAKYAAIRAKASHSPSSYAEYPSGIILDFAWESHVGIQNLVPSGWRGKFSDVATSNDFLYVLTTTNKVKSYSIKDKVWKHVGVGPASREFKRISANKNGDVAFVTQNNNIWVNRRFVSTGGVNRGFDVGLNSQALWFIGLDHTVSRYDLASKRVTNYGGYAKTIDVGEDDVPWVTGKDDSVWYLHKYPTQAINRHVPARDWRTLKSKGRGLDIAISQPGRPWVIGMDNALWSYHPELQKWHRYAGNYNQVSAAPNNLPAMINSSGKLDFLLRLNNKAIDIGFVGSGDKAAALVTNSDYNLWKFSAGNWFLLKQNVARVDGNSKGDIWIVSKDHEIFQRPAGSKKWIKKQGWAMDIAVGDDGTVVVIGTNSTIWKYAGKNKWSKLPGAAVKVSVSPNGQPWVVNAGTSIFKFENKKWVLSTGKAYDINVSSDNTVWVLGTDEHVWKLSRGNNQWTKINGAGKAITSDDHNLPWVVGEDFAVWQSKGAGNQ